MKAPLYLPRLNLEADGAPLAASQQKKLVDVRVQQRLSMPALCELVFLDDDGAFSTAELTRIGCAFRVEMNDDGSELFSGEVTGVDYSYRGSGREVRVRGYDVLNRLGRRQSVRCFLGKTLEEIACELTADLGIDVLHHAPDRPWDRVMQHDQTDLRLLSELAERRGLYFFLRDETLHMATLEGVDEPRRLRLGADLLEARFAHNEVSRCNGVSAVGWDAWLAKAYSAGATTPRLARGSLTAGSDDATTGAFERVLVNQPVRGDRDAESLAQAELDFRAVAGLTLSGVANGDVLLQPGTPVRVDNVAESLEGPYVLTSVNHIIHPLSGYVSEIDTAATRLPPRRGLSATVGVVSSTDDPQRLGRLQLSLPAFGEVTTDWVQAVAPWAGAGKGVMCQPDENDLVLFLYFDADPTQGIVLGSLYGMEAPPSDWKRSGSSQCYAFLTPGGQKIRLDDSTGVIRIENKPGSYVEFSPERTTVHSSTELRIEAPGQPVVISGKSIDFQRAA